jgi:hypothetical protein
MAMDTFIVFAASYDTLGAVEADYPSVRDFYLTSGLVDTYDAAAITRDDTRKVRIVVKHELEHRPAGSGTYPQQGHEGRLPSVRAELLPALPPGRPDGSAHRHVNLASWLPLRGAGVTASRAPGPDGASGTVGCTRLPPNNV